MTNKSFPPDPQYDSLASPLKSVGHFAETTQEALFHEESGVLDVTTFKRRGLIPPRRGTQVLRVGDLDIIAGKTTPVQSSNSSSNFSCFMAMPFVGGFTTRDGALFDEVSPGDIYLNQNYYATSTMGCLSSLFFALDQRRLDRSMRSISGGVSLNSLGTSLIIKGGRGSNGEAGSGSKLWSLINFIDELHREHAWMPSVLGLDETLYRLLSLCLLETAGKIESARKHWETSNNTWTNPMDDLVDYIRTNTHLNLTLNDLEEQSHYSGRHLQKLFKEKFNCTPMQFVRRQRLSAAMEKLQGADKDETVTTVSRDIGYRHLSSFTQDFKREFGVSPSVVLRASRGSKHQ